MELFKEQMDIIKHINQKRELGNNAFILVGHPGFGKTTTAKLYSQIKKLKALEICGAGLTGTDLQEFLKKTDEYDIVILDEIFHFSEDSENIFSYPVETIMQFCSEVLRKGKMIIATGPHKVNVTKEMKDVFEIIEVSYLSDKSAEEILRRELSFFNLDLDDTIKSIILNNSRNNTRRIRDMVRILIGYEIEGRKKDYEEFLSILLDTSTKQYKSEEKGIFILNDNRDYNHRKI